MFCSTLRRGRIMISLGYDEDIEAGGQVVGSSYDEPLLLPEPDSIPVDLPFVDHEVDVEEQIRLQVENRKTKGRRIPPTLPANANRHVDKQKVAGVSCAPAPLSDANQRADPAYDRFTNDLEMEPRPKRSKAEDENDPLDWYKHYDNPVARELEAKERRARQTAECFDRMIRQIDAIKSGHNLILDSEQNSTDSDTIDDLTRYRPSRIYSLPPTDLDWVAFSSPDGRRRLYLNRKPESSCTIEGDINETGRLLGKPFSTMMDEARTTLEQAANPPPSEDESMIETQPPVPENTMETNENNLDEDEQAVQRARLWVDKYKPYRFIDLLSDDGINRCLLTWLRLWDECVFHQKNAALQRAQEVQKQTGVSKFAPNSNSAAGGGNNFKGKKKFFGKGAAWSQTELSLQLDKFKRPDNKIALLCGPPGLGKTTLAHVIADHAGYNVIEMNASDDRQLDKFEDRVEGALAASRTIDGVGAGKPTCLIVDEIDGAPTPSINYLVSLVRDSITRKKKKRILKRPIICICNDLYAASLRELRKVALVLQFPETNNNRLVERLKVICRLEQMRADTAALELLCAKTEQDVRSCVNYLQFTAANSKPKETLANRHAAAMDLTVRDVEQTACGQKDSHKSLFQVWRMVFSLAEARKSLAGPSNASANSNKAKSADEDTTDRFKAMLSAVYSCGETEKLTQGCFENYPNAKPRDAGPNMCAAAGNWLCLSDEMDTLLKKTQRWQLMAYQNYVPVVFHLMFASNVNMNIQYPQMLQQLSSTKQAHHGTLNLMLDEYSTGSGTEHAEKHVAHPQVRGSYTSEQMLMTVLPLLVQCIRPSLKPMNAQLYSAKERAALERVCDVMIHYNLSYRQQRMPDASYDYLLEPPIESLVTFPEQAMDASRTLTYSTKQLISREVEMERVRRLEAALAAKRQPEYEKVTQTGKSVAIPVDDPAEATSPPKKTNPFDVPKKKRTATTGKLPSGTATTGPEEVSSSSNHHQSAVSGALWFKYNDGSSNAIRRNLRMTDLLS